MANKLEKASKEVIDFVTNVIAEVMPDYERFIEFRFFDVPKQNTMVKVTKGSPIVECLANAVDVVVVYVCENIYNKLDEETRRLLIINAVSGIYFDSEKDKLYVTQPDLVVSSGCYQMYGSKLVDAIELCTHTAKIIEEEKKREKQAQKEAAAARKREKKQSEE